MNQSNPSPSFFRIRNLVFLAAFFTILLLPAFLKLPPPSDFQTQPGKFLSAHPELRTYWFLTQLPSEYQDYFSNHFFLRDRGVIWINEILSHFGSRTFHDVLVGKNGWLYLTDEDNLSYYQCDQPFTPAELERIVARVKDLRDFSRENGAEFVLLIAPDKESIYPEYLPDGIQKSGKTCRLDQALQTLKEAGLGAPDLRVPLREQKTKSQVYFKTDTHWNDTGAFLVYQTIFSDLKKRFPTAEIWTPSDFKPSLEEKSGDLAHLIPLLRPITETTMVLEPARERKAVVSQGGDTKTMVSESGISSNPNAVIFRDSFFMGLLPFFAESFNRAVYRWSFDFDHDLIRTEKPNLVIYELAERYLGNLAR
jgi:alginate O-acetyltransferase complex protein AlgJ